jgi:hypothetical protein
MECTGTSLEGLEDREGVLMGDGTGPILILTPDMQTAHGDDDGPVAHCICLDCYPNYEIEPHKALCGVDMPPEYLDHGTKWGPRCPKCVAIDSGGLPCPNGHEAW